MTDVFGHYPGDLPLQPDAPMEPDARGEGRWFVRHRQAWIAETLRVFGFINREHIMKKFEVSLPQASNDLKQFQAERPGLMAYNSSTKRYEIVR